MWALVSFSLCSAMGQCFIYYTIAEFSPLLLATVTTTRKIFSTLVSVFRDPSAPPPAPRLPSLNRAACPCQLARAASVCRARATGSSVRPQPVFCAFRPRPFGRGRAGGPNRGRSPGRSQGPPPPRRKPRGFRAGPGPWTLPRRVAPAPGPPRCRFVWRRVCVRTGLRRARGFGSARLPRAARKACVVGGAHAQLRPPRRSRVSARVAFSRSHGAVFSPLRTRSVLATHFTLRRRPRPSLSCHGGGGGGGGGAGNSLNEMQWAGCLLVFAGIIGEQIASFAGGGKKKKH